MKRALLLLLLPLSVWAHAEEELEISLGWEQVMENEDGSELTDLAGFRVYASAGGGAFVQVHEVTDPQVRGVEFTFPQELPVGVTQLDVVMTSYNDGGNESGHSNVVQRTLTKVLRIPVAPSINYGTVIIQQCQSGATCTVTQEE